MEKSFIERIYQRHLQAKPFLDKKRIESFIDEMFRFLFQLENKKYSSVSDVQTRLDEIKKEFCIILLEVMDDEPNTIAIVEGFIQALPAIHTALLEDAKTILENDPAANSLKEVKIAYPGFYAIALYRFANQLLKQGVPLMPRLWTEYAHSKTGIDIHPGATIGQYFCIDHGTGVVIGETTIIGNQVKIYQGVTLGALSVDKADAHSKRHPTIEDDVVIYSGATILGGNTVIGKGCIIGGNVWLTKSVAPGSKVYYQTQMYHADSAVTDMYVFKNDQNEMSH